MVGSFSEGGVGEELDKGFVFVAVVDDSSDVVGDFGAIMEEDFTKADFGKTAIGVFAHGFV